jgi:hypothetical protein
VRYALAVLALVMGCASSPTALTESVSGSADIVGTVSYRGACLSPNGGAARCDVTYYRDADLGGPQTFTNVTSWVMTAPVDAAKDIAFFKFKARYSRPVSAWSPTIFFKYVPSTGGTVFLATVNPPAPGAPTVALLPYTLIP